VASRVALTDSELPLVARALRNALADTSLARTAVCVYAALLLASHHGQVEGLSLEDLSKRAGVPRHQVDRALKQLSTVGRIQASQPRPYRPNRYLLQTVRDGNPDTRPNPGALLCSRSTSDDGGAPREELRSSVGPSSAAPGGGTAPGPHYGDNLYPEEVHEDQSNPMLRLAKLSVCPPPVWHMLWGPNPPCGSSSAEIYLVFAYATRVLKLSPPEDGLAWSKLEQLLDAGALSDPEIQHQIHEAIIEHPAVVKGKSLQAVELDALQAVFGEERHA